MTPIGIPFKKAMVTCCCLLLFLSMRADTLHIRTYTPDGEPIALLPYFRGWEDVSKQTDTMQLYARSGNFAQLASLEKQSRTSNYWLSTDLVNETGTTANMVLAFTSLTYVDVYLYENGQNVLHKLTGHFRNSEYIAPGDGRLFVQLHFKPGVHYRLILKVYHSKHYEPVFNFVLQPKDAYITQQHRRELVDAWCQGGVLLFFIYAISSWLVSRFRPYLWLACFIAGIGLYGMASGGYLIEWFFPHNAPTGWLFNIVFAHLGSFGIYMLMIDFWKLKRFNPMLYKLGVVLIIELILITSVGFVINLRTGNFNLTNSINLSSFPLPLGFMCASIWVCWKRLTPPQRYLGYGLLLFFVAAAFTVLNSALIHEKSLQTTSFLSNFTTLAVFLLFATGLKEELRQHEIGKNAALEELNQLQQHQNALLEKKVEDRTSELADRNTKIETLINELNHRVKNNLQLLYSFISLQLPSISDGHAREMLRGNLGKIKAMMLVNQKLFRFDEGSAVLVSDFTTELSTHLQSIYDSRGRIRFVFELDEHIQLQGKSALSFGLILSELLTNSFKYAFADHPDPEIRIAVSYADAQSIRFEYADNGAGMDIDEPGQRITMGVSLVQDLTRQINGKLSVSSHQGLQYQILIPV
ncbi:hypothetical protein HHL16_10380 [Pseudoflavitalea sp. G-6-1-2]|uniref:7TM diverse intracellular signaling domain-containing protein n=1 Tax=Pseudoflavitalea sp. G-6-1-2 TaxID=2728841 RepID=UPI00146A2208|nr:7TM diverse intracellular signaling domain-containing protein [Pseudoflavitalea sp. G-6-1-2]NML21281.1 hypothetical protein [Pseudoflavitalea sp. G-6-1-2]